MITSLVGIAPTIISPTLVAKQSGLRDNKVVQLAKDDGHLLFIEYGSMGFQLSTNGKKKILLNASR